MSGPEQFNAAAVTAPRLIDEFATSYGVNFPSTDGLEKTSFKLVVGSWRRLNYATTATNDFEVNVAEYAPKQCFVTRVQLVDVDIPNTQLLIEEIWNRVYFNLGCVPTPECRTFNFNFHAVCGAAATCTSAVVLPLPYDAVRQWELLPEAGYVRIYLAHRAPRPIVPLVHAWQSLAKLGCGCMRLVGIPGLALPGQPGGTLPLDFNCVVDDSNMSLMVYSVPAWNALAAVVDPAAAPLYLLAAPLPGPSFLAKILSRCVSYDLNTSLLSPTCNPADVATWGFNIAYSEVADTFDVSAKSPGFPARMSVDGPVAEYMGFGSPYFLEPCDGARYVSSGPQRRFQAGDSFAAVRCGDPDGDVQLAAWISTAFNAFVWAPFTFNVTYPGGAAVGITSVGGYMSLAQVAVAVQDALTAAALPAAIVCTLQGPHPYAGLVFTSTLAFGLDFTVDVFLFDASRLGYDVAVYPALPVHCPVRTARHVPLLPGTCGPTCCAPVLYTVPQCLVTARFRAECNQLVFEAQPYAPFAATLAVVDGTYTAASTPTFNANLVAGAAVLIAFDDGTYHQLRAIVVEGGVAEWVLALVDPTADAPALVGVTNVTLVPQSVLPLVLYLQRSNGEGNAAAPCPFPRRHGRTIDPEILGFDALTYESCGKLLTSPGSLEKFQDSYILVCLAFAAGGSPPVTGDVFYPYAKQNTIVFAKVLRGSIFLRADFDRMFDHVFAGTGQHLGFIRVSFMNPNGTPYQTHGHSCSITLKFDARSSALAFGGGHVVVPGEGGPVSMVPLSRGTMIVRDYGNAAYAGAIQYDV